MIDDLEAFINTAEETGLLSREAVLSILTAMSQDDALSFFTRTRAQQLFNDYSDGPY